MSAHIDVPTGVGNRRKRLPADHPEAVAWLAAQQPKSRVAGGPGTELKKLLASWGITDSPSCPCNARAAEMDRNGVAWCREHRAEIIGWLQEGAAAWGWAAKLAAKAMPIGRLVDEAIRRAELASDPPIVVYHVAAMGNWRDVVAEQLSMLARVGLNEVRISHVGGGRAWLVEEAARRNIKATVFSSDPNIRLYETPAMLEIERLAKHGDRPILYMHTKGVSIPDDPNSVIWRRLMGRYTVCGWRENMAALAQYDAVGVNWRLDANGPHFSGNFWLARASWLRQLPPFAEFNAQHQGSRFTCEWWIGATAGIRPKSLVTANDGRWGPHYGTWGARFAAEVAPPTITWVSAATAGYQRDLDRLTASTSRMGPGHTFRFQSIDRFPLSRKFELLREALRDCKTTHLFWIDADCEFLASLQTPDLTGKPLTAVRHFIADDVRYYLPARLRPRIAWPIGPGSWQSCLFGGTLEAMAAQLERLRWMDAAGETYDEFGLVLDWSERADQVLTLPCRYATPSTFAPFPEHEATYQSRAEGSPMVMHHNRASNAADPPDEDATICPVCGNAVCTCLPEPVPTSMPEPAPTTMHKR